MALCPPSLCWIVSGAGAEFRSSFVMVAAVGRGRLVSADAALRRACRLRLESPQGLGHTRTAPASRTAANHRPGVAGRSRERSMPAIKRSSGITIETRGDVAPLATLKLRRRRLGDWPEAAPPSGRRRRAAGPEPAPLSEEEAIVDAF